MIARLRTLPPSIGPALAAAVLLVSGCGTFSDAAATVDGDDIGAGDFEAMLADVGAASLPQIAVDETTGTIDGEGARAVLRLMVQDVVTSSFLADAGEEVTDADREAFLATIDESQLDGMSEELSRLVVDNSAVNAALERVAPPADDELERRYAERPVSTGVVCLRHILVGSESAAHEILDELTAGADFAELASERSTDEGSAANGGALGTDDEPCMDLAAARQSLDPMFLAGAFDAPPGVPVGPVESQFGWHVILARPFDEIGSALSARYADEAGPLGLIGALAAADVTVDPRYGAWNAATGDIVGLG